MSMFYVFTIIHRFKKGTRTVSQHVHEKPLTCWSGLFLEKTNLQPMKKKILQIIGYSIQGVKKLSILLERNSQKCCREDAYSLEAHGGWAVFMSYPDYTIHLSQVFNPWCLESSPKTITLPPLADHLVPHVEMSGNVSLSTYFPNQDDDYIVCFTIFGSKLCYCMPYRDSDWAIIDIPFSYDIDSNVVYSQKDQMFYLLTTGCAYMAALDLKNNKKKPKFMRLQFENFPLMPQYEWEILASCLQSGYIAESSSGERFIVQW